MARKNHQSKIVRPNAQIAAMNLSSIMAQISGLRSPSRPKKPQAIRHRIPIIMFGGTIEPVKIRHVHQNLGKAASPTPISQVAAVS